MTQPDPTPTDEPDLWLQVIDRARQEVHAHPVLPVAMLHRRSLGIERYGTPLQTGNGRDALVDLLDELLDAIVYAEQVIDESSVGRSAHPLAEVQDGLTRYATQVIALMEASP